MGATDSMWPKKRRILLRVLKAVAILRPRRFQGRKTPAAFSERPARQPVLPSVAEGHLSERTFGEVRSDKGPLLFFKAFAPVFLAATSLFPFKPCRFSLLSLFGLLSPARGRGWERGLRTPPLTLS